MVNICDVLVNTDVSTKFSRKKQSWINHFAPGFTMELFVSFLEGLPLYSQIRKYLTGLFFLLAFTGCLSNPAISAPSNSFQPVRSVSEIRQQNIVLQQWELSCAAAALATVLRYQYGVPVTERSVALGLINREEYLANPDLVRIRQGFSFLDLKRYVDDLGYEGVGLGQLELEDLLLRAPVIIPVNLQGFPHFVVFRGATNNSVLLADPAYGNITMSKEKFLNGWIKYLDIGKVGFVVTQVGELAPPGGLSARALDFVMLN